MQANELALIERHLKESRLFQYRPYGHPDTLDENWLCERGLNLSWSRRPWQLDFHNLGREKIERMLMAANRPGKTYSCSMEIAMHMTGRYPDWWRGKIFNDPVRVWAGSPTNQTSRDIQQKALLGGTGSFLGQGAVPKRFLKGKPKKKQAGVSDVIDYFSVKHVSGGESQCIFKTYDQGWRTWQGDDPHIVWMDEEPSKGGVPTDDDYRIFSEAQTRILTSRGILLVGFTPLWGTTKLVEYFQEGRPGTAIVGATWDDAAHLHEKEKADLASRYQDYERETRTKGVPMMGQGRVFSVSEEDIKIDPFELGLHWPKICGIDFGIDHPAAGVWFSHDRDTDILYLYDSYRRANETAVYHAASIKARGHWIPVSWPHDGVNREKSGGRNLYRQYQSHGVKMLPMSARYEKDKGGAQPVEPIVLDVLERMKTGRFKVFSNQHDFFEEFRNYHRKDGVIVPIKDDIMKAAFYAVMMIRYAITPPRRRTHASAQPIRAHL